MRALDLAGRVSVAQAGGIQEQLKQCPEAFKVGELLERVLTSLNYNHDEAAQPIRCLPPAGAVIPPIV